MTSPCEQPLFLRIPAEIRLMIYELLLDDGGNKTFTVETLQPHLYTTRLARHGTPLRTSFHILGPWVQRAPTTTNRLSPDHPANLHTAILSTNHQIYEEASVLLYANHTFDFGEDISAITPFLQDLVPENRLVRKISMVKEGGDYEEFDRSEWKRVASYLAQHMQIRKVTVAEIAPFNRRYKDQLYVVWFQGTGELRDMDNYLVVPFSSHPFPLDRKGVAE